VKDIGIIIPIYQRYDLTLASLYSLYFCKDFYNIKIVFIDDGSHDERLTALLKDFKKDKEKDYNTIDIIQHAENWGMYKYYQSIFEALKLMYDCNYVLFSANDILYNPYIFQVIRRSYHLFNDNIKCIEYWIDSRSRYKDGYKSIKKFNSYFDTVLETDGFLSLFDRYFISHLNWDEIRQRIDRREDSSFVWKFINEQLRNFKILRYKESLCQHIGNIKSSMHIRQREIESLVGLKCNLFKKPKILENINEQI